MDEENLQKIKKLLQQEEVQARVWENIRKSREEAKITIGRAAELFDLRTSKLRELDLLLSPARSKDTTTGQRQYSLAELDKLAVIRELLRVGYSVAEIPEEIDMIWQGVAGSVGEDTLQARRDTLDQPTYINQRVRHIYYQELVWRYIISRTLRLALILIGEDVPNIEIGIILPLNTERPAPLIEKTDRLPELGESLVGWIGDSRSFYTFLSPIPCFEYPSDYRLETLPGGNDEAERASYCRVYIVISRRAKPLNLDPDTARCVQSLLNLIYEQAKNWRPYFLPGQRYVAEPSINFNSSMTPTNAILDSLADMVVYLGGKVNGQDRWLFCCVMLPEDSIPPLKRRSLIIRAQSKNSPYKLGSAVSPEENPNSPSLKALQSGRIIYRPRRSEADTTMPTRDLEGEAVRSVIAASIGGEREQPVAVLYVASQEENAFSAQDQRMLRLMGKLMEELIATYRMQERVLEGLEDIITQPDVVDIRFGNFLSENDFVNDVEEILARIQKKELMPEEMFSFISVDIDNQSILASKYGEVLTRNLNREVGVRIQKQFWAIFTTPDNRQPYHMYADRFYLLLKGLSLEGARARAELLRKALEGPYMVDALRPSSGQPKIPGRMVDLPDVTARLGVAFYKTQKLEELLQRYPEVTAVTNVRELITGFSNEMLKLGQKEGGNVVMSWDPDNWDIIR